jgi:glutamate dehydrogenase/leucine dehydrogenase
VARIAAATICAGANNPVSPEAEGVLLERGVSYPPDFVTNSGGVLGGTLEFAGVPFDRINAVIEKEVGRHVSELLDRAEALGVAPRQLAEADAEERHARVRREAEHPGLLGRLRELGLDAYRRAWIPQRPVSWVAPRYLARLMA